jgi:hypothetical protein
MLNDQSRSKRTLWRRSLIQLVQRQYVGFLGARNISTYREDFDFRRQDLAFRMLHHRQAKIMESLERTFGASQRDTCSQGFLELKWCRMKLMEKKKRHGV